MYELLRHRLPAENMLNCAQEEKVEPIQFVWAPKYYVMLSISHLNPLKYVS
jgi:hypothetical protein